MEALTLYELNGLVRGTLERTLQAEYWLQAELSVTWWPKLAV